MTKDEEALPDKIRAALDGAGEAESLSALSFVLVERALNVKRKDGTVGTPGEVKRFIAELTFDMVDICHQRFADECERRRKHRGAEWARHGGDGSKNMTKNKRAQIQRRRANPNAGRMTDDESKPFAEAKRFAEVFVRMNKETEENLRVAVSESFAALTYEHGPNGIPVKRVHFADGEIVDIQAGDWGLALAGRSSAFDRVVERVACACLSDKPETESWAALKFYDELTATYPDTIEMMLHGLIGDARERMKN
jgi:hypothetical protein